MYSKDPAWQSQYNDWLKQMTDQFGAGNFAVPELAGMGGGSPSPTTTTPTTPQPPAYLGDRQYTAGATNPVLKPTTPVTPPPSGYNINPGPSGYNPIFGGVPGPIGLPSPFQDLSGVFPALGGANSAAGAALLAELGGQVSPGTQALLQDKAAQFGVSSGMPGSGLARNANLRNLGLTSEALTQQGLRDYSSLIPTISKTQTVDPNLQAEIAARNAIMAAAPIPAQAQTYAQNLFNRYLQNMRGPGGGSQGFLGPGGGTQAQPDSTKPFVGGTPSYGSLGADQADPFAYAWQSSRPADDSADLLNEFFGEGQYAPPPDFNPMPSDGGYSGDPFQDFFTGFDGG